MGIVVICHARDGIGIRERYPSFHPVVSILALMDPSNSGHAQKKE
jgi:hypothetical protein